jgi:hypothetical protein
MNEETSLRQLIGSIAGNVQQDVEVVQGNVTRVSPLNITLVNDAKVTLTGTDVIIPKHIGKTTATVTVSGKASTITIDNSLKAGEKVHLLVFNNGKKYFLLDKV